MTFIHDTMAESGVIFPEDVSPTTYGFYENSAEFHETYGWGAYHGMVILYPNLDGLVTEHAHGRIRYTTPLPNSYRPERPIRYRQPKGSKPRAYFPNCTKVPWSIIAGDPTYDTLITEGEKKAFSASWNLQIPTIGLGGVSMFRDKADGELMLADFDPFEWEGRKVFIVYDSDKDENVNVARAELVLANSLSAKGADVYITSLPHSAGGKKLGLDDAIVEYGTEHIALLLAESEPFINARVLHNFSKECVYISESNFYVDLNTMKPVGVVEAKQGYYANRRFLKRELNKKGEPMSKDASVFEEYNKWPGRKTYKRITHKPGAPAVVDGCLNTWQYDGPTPVEGDVSMYTDLCKYMFENEPSLEAYWHNWVAYIVQHNVKMQTAWAFFGPMTGTGKTLLAETVGRLFGYDAYAIGSDALLNDDRHDWSVNKQIIVIDDMGTHRAKRDADKLKHVITRNKILVNPKFVKPYEVEDFANFIFTSNYHDALHVDKYDRRYFIVPAPNHRLPEEFYLDFIAGTKGAGLSALRYYYEQYNIAEDFHAGTKPPLTEARAEAVRESATDLEATVEEVLERIIIADVSVITKTELASLVNEKLTMRQQVAQASFVWARVLKKLEINMARIGPETYIILVDDCDNIKATYDSELVKRSNALTGGHKF